MLDEKWRLKAGDLEKSFLRHKSLFLSNLSQKGLFNISNVLTIVKVSLVLRHLRVQDVHQPGVQGAGDQLREQRGAVHPLLQPDDGRDKQLHSNEAVKRKYGSGNCQYGNKSL